jgi:hypothetical protein
MQLVNDAAGIMSAILREYALPIRGHHGVIHWARVLENGLRIADANGADREVVTLFALTGTAYGAESSPDPCVAPWYTWTMPGSSCCLRRAGCTPTGLLWAIRRYRLAGTPTD